MRLIGHNKVLGQAGDTIIEVIIVLAVLGLAISTSYATASRSLSSMRQAQENGHATQLLQSQLETLRSFATLPASDPNYIFRIGAFCVTALGTLSPPIANNCQFDIYYDVIINYSLIDNSFTAVAKWDDVRGQGKDTVTLVYRMHQPI